MHGLVSEAFQLIELIVNNEEIWCRSNDFPAVCAQHVFQIIQLGTHGQKIVHHFFCGLKIPMDHRNLYRAQHF